MCDGIESLKQILTELEWLWYAVHYHADILRWVSNLVYIWCTKVEPKAKSHPKTSQCMAAILFLEMAQASHQCGTCAGWRSCSHGLGVSRYTARQTKAPSKLKAPVMAGIWFYYFTSKWFKVWIKKNCFQKPANNTRPGKQVNFCISLTS